MTKIVLILGSAPNAIDCHSWPKDPFSDIVAINNAWRVRPDWDYLIHPEDFPHDRRPVQIETSQTVVSAEDYVPLQNLYGGFVYAGGTMAFTAGYWALAALQPSIIAFLGCDMVYPSNGKTHFYGSGRADPLRQDISLRSLEAKSARLYIQAAKRGCQCVNLSEGASRLLFPRAARQTIPALAGNAMQLHQADSQLAEAEEKRLGYFVESGRYWEMEKRFDPAKIDKIDRLWLDLFERASVSLAA